MTMRMLGAGRRCAGAGVAAGHFAAASVALVMLAAPATAQQTFDTAQIIRDTAGNPRQAAEAALRVERIEAQMRTLNGQVEELTFQIRQLTEQIRRMQEDNEFRFQELEAGRGKKRSDAPAAAPAAGGTDTATLTIPPADAAPLGNPLDVGSGFAMEPLTQAEGLPGVSAGSSAVTAAPPQTLGQLPVDDAGGFDFFLDDLHPLARGLEFPGALLGQRVVLLESLKPLLRCRQNLTHEIFLQRQIVFTHC